MSPIALIGSLGGSGTFSLQDGRLARLDPMAFDAMIRAVDQGLPIDLVRVRDRMETALAARALPIALAEGAITISAGQARLSNTVVRAQGADLLPSGSVNLADMTIDARLSLTGRAGAGGASTGRPEIVVMLKGPIAAPKRTIDVAALASWLALRAVEQQTKKLDALEGLGPPPGLPAGDPPAQPPPPVPPVAPIVTPAPPAATGPEPAKPAPGEAKSSNGPDEAAAAKAAVEPEKPAQQPRRVMSRSQAKAQKPKSQAEHAAPLDLRPGQRAQNGGVRLPLPLFDWRQP
jgi:large subunit ribosomal protein L24